jgi:type IV secretion system protein TrbG
MAGVIEANSKKENPMILHNTLLLLSLLLSGCMAQLPLAVPPIQLSVDKPLHKAPRDPVRQLTCKPLMLSQIELPPDETVLSLSAGDTARWSFQTIVSNTDTDPITHILIKPKKNDLRTNLFIATNQGLHQIDLLSNDETRPAAIKLVGANHAPSSFRKIDTRYTIKISYFDRPPAWQPRSIYNDGKSVFIHMPHLQQGAAPNFYVIDENKQRTVVNYEVANNTYRIDQLFSKGILLQGIGRKQQKIFINYVGIY